MESALSDKKKPARNSSNFLFRLTFFSFHSHTQSYTHNYKRTHTHGHTDYKLSHSLADQGSATNIVYKGTALGDGYNETFSTILERCGIGNSSFTGDIKTI